FLIRHTKDKPRVKEILSNTKEIMLIAGFI
ncbi:hypothetical protein CGSSp19BS75_09299, partial [Streptococcus pneumoniae SP19-BS75]